MPLDFGEYLKKLTSGEDALAEIAALALVEVYQNQTGEVLASLDELLNNSNAEWRWWALRVLAEIPGEQSLQRLLLGLSDPQADVRQCAALGLRTQADPRAIPSLVDALMDADGLVVQLAGDALIEIGESAVPALLALMEGGQPSARREALRSLASIGDERAIPVLLEVLEEDSCWMEYWANYGLEKMGLGLLYFDPGG